MTTRDRRGAKISMMSTNATKCDICETPIKEFEIIYDCPMQGTSSWAFMCNNCVDDYGRPKMGTVHTILHGE
jgi:hypothetical protein